MVSKSIPYKGCTITIDVMMFTSENTRREGGTKYHEVVTSITSPGRGIQYTTKENIEDGFLELLLLKREHTSKEYIDKEIDRLTKERMNNIGYK